MRNGLPKICLKISGFLLKNYSVVIITVSFTKPCALAVILVSPFSKPDAETDKIMQQAFHESENDVPVIVAVTIDYTKKTYMTKGVVKVNLARFSFKEKVRFISKKQTDLDNYLESVFYISFI